MVLEVMIDSKTVFSVVAKDGKTTERQQQNDILALRESYDSGELQRITCILGPEQPADPLIKPALSTVSPLYDNMWTNTFTLKPNGWRNSHERKYLECRY